MGCSKNLVDSELITKQFEANGYHCTHDSKRPQGEIAVINTCGFIVMLVESLMRFSLVFSLSHYFIAQIYTFFTNLLTYINLFILYLFVQSFALTILQIQRKNSIK